MIDQFEIALADLLADRAGSHPAVQSVRRAGVEKPDPADGAALVVVAVVDAVACDEVGIDRPERVTATIERRSQRLGGRVKIEVSVGPSDGPGSGAQQRTALWQAADAVLVVVHNPEVRDGSVWGADHAHGFAIDGFRLARVSEPPPPDSGNDDRLDIWCDYAGRFWPVEPLIEGDVIVEPIPTRLVLLDARLPIGLAAQSGGPELVVPLGVDLRSFDATPRLVARLSGAAPPGELIGDDADVPTGSVGYLPDDRGRFTVVFRPASSLTAPADAHVGLGLASADRPTVTIGELQIKVLP